MIQQISGNLFKKNRKKLQTELESDAVAIFFSNYQMPRNSGQYYPFRQNSDLFYLSGIEQPDTTLVLTREDEYLFMKQSSPLQVLWEGESLSKERAAQLSGMDKIIWNPHFEETWDIILKTKKSVFFNIPLNIKETGMRSKDEEFFTFFRKRYPFHEVHSIRNTMNKIRHKKENEEIEEIKRGINITWKAFAKILHILKPGINEKELEAQLRYDFMGHGSSGPAYDPIIASGKNACILHYTENNDICRDGELLLMDIGAEVNNYASDISRTVPVNGKFTERQKTCYTAVLEVQESIIQEIKPGTTLAELNKKTKTLLTQKHIELGLYNKSDLEKEDLARKYFPHGVSHFMGLDVHDTGERDTLLEEGMVISCEPGLYIPEENIGIRIEDDILVGNPSVNLSKDIPKTIKEIEQLIGKS